MIETSQPGIIFWILSFIILVSAFLVVSLKNIFHCALFLVICLTAVAGIFVLLDAEFLAAAQVLIYVGAVAILMIFGIMLTAGLSKSRASQTTDNAVVAFFVSLVFALGAYVLIRGTDVWRYAREALPEENTLAIGKLLLTKYMLPFELISVLLLAAMIGAIVLARGEKS